MKNKTKKKVEKAGGLVEFSPFHMEIFGQSQSGQRFLLLCSWKEKWGKGDRRWPHSPLEPHDPFPMWHIPEPWKGEGRGTKRVGWGREDGLTVNQHSVILSSYQEAGYEPRGRQRTEMNVLPSFPGGVWHSPNSYASAVPDQEDPRRPSLKSSPDEGMC